VTAPRFLIDENLSPALVEPARRHGFEAMHVNYLGLRTETDWDLLKVIAEQDWVLVTNNAIEFRADIATSRCILASSFCYQQ
jgi:predicted nuclease of predicted toxin-antitoxin system